MFICLDGTNAAVCRECLEYQVFIVLTVFRFVFPDCPSNTCAGKKRGKKGGKKGRTPKEEKRKEKKKEKEEKFVNLVDLVKSFPTSIYLQRFVSIQPRTSLSKFANKSLKVS